jgi:hypothetical protein
LRIGPRIFIFILGTQSGVYILRYGGRPHLSPTWWARDASVDVGSCNTIPSWCWKISIPEIIAIQGDCFCDMLESYQEADMQLYGWKYGFIPMVEDFIVYHGDIGSSDQSGEKWYFSEARL